MVAGRWKDLQDRCKARSKFLEDVKDFQDTHDQLSAWLTAKERMMSVLGPIASDPRLVHNQLQQVQVLREEFKVNFFILFATMKNCSPLMSLGSRAASSAPGTFGRRDPGSGRAQLGGWP